MVVFSPVLLLIVAVISVQGLTNNYYVESLSNIQKNGFKGIFGSADYKGIDNYYRKPLSKIAKKLNVTVLYEANNEFSVTIKNRDQSPGFTMAHEYPFSYTKAKPEDATDLEYKVDIKKEPLSISVKRILTDETIFDTSSFDLIYSELFITFGTTLPSKYLYGLGERRTMNFLYDTGLYTIWSKDQAAIIDTGAGSQETYGAHPVYLMRETSGRWHVMLFRTINALDFFFNAESKTLKYMVTGGLIELKFFLGDENPDTAIKMYHNYINRWTMMPFWSFGYHQSRWGYLFLEDLINVVGNMSYYNLPLDTIWSDIDYMDNFADFTVDTDRYNLEDFRELLETVRWVPIVDSGISLNKTAPAFVRGTELNVWVRSARNDSNYLIGVVWPGLVQWPDWLNPNASKYWSEMLELLYSYVPYAGIWLDMNENSNFCFGEYPNQCYLPNNYLPRDPNIVINITSESIKSVLMNVTIPPDKEHYPKPKISNFSSADLPYVPGGTPLEDHGMSLNAIHYGGVLSFDFHNLNSFYETYYTYQDLLDISGKRPFILTRGNFIGSGQFASHWTGDNSANWEFLRVSIGEIFNMQLFGIPMAGADICGFLEDTTEELCARWMQLGAFYPFMRNHNHILARSQEPYVLGPTVLETSRAALLFRYSILKYYYSIFIKNKGVGTIFRPLFFDFSSDENLLNLQTQFLIGSDLMVAAAVDEGISEVGVYFPKGAKWYDLFTGDIMLDVEEGPKNITVKVPFNQTLPVFIKAGSIIHMQNVENVQNTDDLDNKFNLVVALTPSKDNKLVASGQIMGIMDYNDDLSVNKCINENDCLINIMVEATLDKDDTVRIDLSFDLNKPQSTLEEIYIQNIKFYGVNLKTCKASSFGCNQSSSLLHCKSKTPILIQPGLISFVLSYTDDCNH